jgi:hypothetical protein
MTPDQTELEWYYQPEDDEPLGSGLSWLVFRLKDPGEGARSVCESRQIVAGRAAVRAVRRPCVLG